MDVFSTNFSGLDWLIVTAYVAASLLIGIICVAMSLGDGKRSALFLGLLLGAASVGLTLAAGYLGFAHVRDELARTGRDVTPIDTVDSANRVLGPVLWTSTFFGGMFVVGMVSILVGKRDA